MTTPLIDFRSVTKCSILLWIGHQCKNNYFYILKLLYNNIGLHLIKAKLIFSMNIIIACKMWKRNDQLGESSEGGKMSQKLNQHSLIFHLCCRWEFRLRIRVTHQEAAWICLSSTFCATRIDPFSRETTWTTESQSWKHMMLAWSLLPWRPSIVMRR